MTELRRITAVDLLAQVNNGLGGASTIDLDHLKAVLAALFVGNGYALFDALALKADADSVAASLATKADQDGVTAALALKADLDAMIAALAAKADQTGVDSALALKADADTVTTALAGKANAANAALTGVPVAPTAALGTNTQQLATTAFVAAALAALADSVPETLDTLAELAQALGDDPNFATTVTNLIATKLDASSASTFGRSLIDDADAAAARTTLGLDALLAAKAPTASPTFTGGITTGVNRLLAEATDLDTLVTAGFYRGLNLVNAPVTGWVYVTVDGHDASYAFQTVKRLFDAAGNSRQWMRMMHNGVWQDWTEVVTEQNYTSVILDATTSLSGLMSASDKLLLDILAGNVANPKEYGADPANTAAVNFAAFQAAIDDVQDDGNGKKLLYIPAGEWHLSGKLNATASIAIEGDGLEQTILVWDASSTSQGISIAYSSLRDKAHPSIRKLSLVRDSAYGGVAIDINGSGAGSHPDSHRVTIEHVRIDRGQRDEGTGSWQIGIRLTSVNGADIQYVSGQGDINNTTGTTYYGTFLRVLGLDSDAEVNGHINVVNTQAERWAYGANISNCEGIYFDDPRYFNVDYGIVYSNSGADTGTTYSPRVVVDGGHIKPLIQGISLSYTTMGRISGVYFLDTLGTVTEFINTAYTLNFQIFGNTFEGLNSSAVKAIKLTGSSFENAVHGNTFVGTGNTCIYLDATSEANSIGINHFRNYNWTKYVDNQSAYAMHMNAKYTIRNTAAVSIPNAAVTNMAFSGAYVADLGTGWYTAGPPSVITIKRSGRYRIAGYVQFTANGVGRRTMDIVVNSANAVGSNGMSVPAVTGGNTILTVASEVLKLNAGDTVGMTVYQDSGAALDVAVNATLSIEYLGPA